VRFGTAGTTADTSRLTFATGTQVANADSGVAEIMATVRGPIGASCIVQGNLNFPHTNGTGFSSTAVLNVANTSAAFDITTAGMTVGVSLTTGASHSITVTQVVSEVFNI